MERPTECVALPTTARSNAEIPSCKLLSSGLGLHRSASWDSWRWPGTNGEMTLPPFSHSLGVGCWLGAKALFPISDRIERSGFSSGLKGSGYSIEDLMQLPVKTGSPADAEWTESFLR